MNGELFCHILSLSYKSMFVFCAKKTKGRICATEVSQAKMQKTGEHKISKRFGTSYSYQNTHIIKKKNYLLQNDICEEKVQHTLSDITKVLCSKWTGNLWPPLH